jgi:Mg2+-importing ATPase
VEAADVARRLGSSLDGLSGHEATRRLGVYGPNQVREGHRLSRLHIIGRQIRSPLLLLLVFAAAASALTGEWLDASIVMTIVIATVVIGYLKEYSVRTRRPFYRSRPGRCC